MKILFFADLHGDMKTLDALRKKARDVDIVICAGDFTVMERDFDNLIEEFDNFQRPFILIHGNHEDEDRVREACQNSKNLIFLHKGVHHILDYLFMGYGGDGFSTTDEEFEEVADLFFKREIEVKKKRRIVLITHGPPYGTKIDNVDGQYQGNKSYRKFIDEVKPHLVISGHLHETAGKHEKIGRTLLVNPGKKGAVIKL